MKKRFRSVVRVHVPPPKIDLHQSNTVPILNIQFVNTGNYNYFDNIYDYITIDSTWAFTFAYIDKQMNIKAFVNYAASNGSYWDISDRKSPYKEHKQIIKKISKYEPDLILRSAMLGGGFGVMYDDGFMYIKGNKIYKFIMNSGKSYELNEYFRNYLRIDDIHRYLDFSYIPLIYNKEDKNKRRTGNARENEKIICP